ncbi:MAG: PAS domain-containing methyl-accepting chemotaxis protein [Curvibacter sp.]|nr:MAG: PAS domain-containing methyl-accepting chemotaxis protein [Curvibacter sp.]
MKINLPVTGQEHGFAADATLMSVTDGQSHLIYANAAFLNVSGFERDEIMGQAHNIVRHPDMPSEAFEDMWATLKSGLSWSALVKNRRKDGDHYWVRANATPLLRDGVQVGYMSVRTKPTREEVQHAERMYRAFREGRAGALRFHRGLVVRSGWQAWGSLLQRLSVAGRIHLGLSLLALALGAAALRVFGMDDPLAWRFALACAGGCAVLSLFLDRTIAAPLRSVLVQALRVAAGHPAQVTDLNRIDEVGMILRAVNQAGLNLRSLVDDVGGQISGLRAVSSEITQGNDDLHDRTRQSNAKLDETASSMEQMTGSVASNADSARQAAHLAEAASAAATQGRNVISQVTQTMGGISDASQRIGDIIGVIDGIAFQTNILALNAAIEAAHAGEQGRGFAVVAGEVRSLAQRSALAAKEIAKLIQDSAQQVERGTRLVGEAGQSMDGIVEQVDQVTDLIRDISIATREQSQGIGGVNHAIGELDQMTQQNAALVAQSANAAARLKAQAGSLHEAISVFSIRSQAGPEGVSLPAGPKGHALAARAS